MRTLNKFLFFALFSFFSTALYAQRDEVNTFYIRKQTGLSLAEHERQKILRETSAQNYSVETVIDEETTNFQEFTTTIKERLGFIQFTLSSIPAAWQINLHTETTTKSIEEVWKIFEDKPELLLTDQTFDYVMNFVHEIEMNTRLLAGLLVVGDDVFQMEIADRKRLLTYVVDEFRMLSYQSRSLLRFLRNLQYRISRRTNPLNDYINRDIEKFEKTINGILQ